MSVRHPVVSFKPTTWLKIKVSVNDKMSVLRILNSWMEKSNMKANVNHEDVVLEFLYFVYTVFSQSTVYLTKWCFRRPSLRIRALGSIPTMDWSSWLYPLNQLLGQLDITKELESICPLKKWESKGKGS